MRRSVSPEEHLLGPLGKAAGGDVFFLWARLSAHSVRPEATTALAAAEKEADRPGSEPRGAQRSGHQKRSGPPDVQLRRSLESDSPLALPEAMG